MGPSGNRCGLPGTTARLFLCCGDPPGAGLWLCQGKACLSVCGRLGWPHRAELGRRACVHPKGAWYGPSCPQPQLVLSKDAGSGSAFSNLLPHLSVIKISVLNLQCGVGRESLSEPLGQGRMPAQEREHGWEPAGVSPRHRLLPQCLPSSSAGETEARAALTAGMVVKSERGAHFHCKAGTLTRFVSLQTVFLCIFQSPAVLQAEDLS